MSTRILPAAGDPANDAGSAAAVEAAASVLTQSDTVVLPTDTVYGLAALATDAVAVRRVFELKQRSDRQPLAVLVANVRQARELVDLADPEIERVMATLWPGALTLVLPRRSSLRGIDLGGDAATIGVRCPASSVARAVATFVGPIATTSANRHGDPTPHEAVEAAASLAGEVGVVLDGGTCRDQPSTVVDATVRPWRLLRRGPISLERVVAVAASSATTPDRDG